MPMIGSRSQFGFVVGRPHDEWPTTGTREVDIYAAGKWLTCDDNSVFVPQFANDLMAEVQALLSDSAAEEFRRPYADLSPADNHRRFLADAKAGDNGEFWKYRFMDWGPTTDSVKANLFLEGGTAFIAFSFWREQHHDPSELGQVFVAELPEKELIRVLHRAAWVIGFGLR